MVEAVGGLFPPRTHVTIHYECSSVVWGLHRGSTKTQMNPPLRALRVLLAEKRCVLQVLHIKGVLNSQADFLSQNRDKQSYCLDPGVFRLPCRRSIFKTAMDLFADTQNFQVPKFYSWRACR